jgi:hypothetical protein
MSAIVNCSIPSETEIKRFQKKKKKCPQSRRQTYYAVRQGRTNRTSVTVFTPRTRRVVTHAMTRRRGVNILYVIRI